MATTTGGTPSLDAKKVAGATTGSAEATSGILGLAGQRGPAMAADLISRRPLKLPSPSASKEPASSPIRVDVQPGSEWMSNAACRGMDANIFFPERGDDLAPARAICARCPVSNDCLIFAYTHPLITAGVWGGTSHNERRRAGHHQKARSGPIPMPGHGTNSGYGRHRRAGTTACDACKAAHSAYVRLRKLITEGAA
jgi:WhiB family redox-sensing transcriptional regulator